MNKKQRTSKLCFCESCDYSTFNIGDFNKHNSTRKHILMTNSAVLAMSGNENKANASSNYNCSCCNFNTSKKSNYDKHLLTEKHKNNAHNEPKFNTYNCSHCNKEYLNYNALWKHKKICVVNNKEHDPETLQNTFISSGLTPDIFIEVLKESKELQHVLIEQNNTGNLRFPRTPLPFFPF